MMADPWAQFKDAPATAGASADPWAQFQDAPGQAPQSGPPRVTTSAPQAAPQQQQQQSNPFGAYMQSIGNAFTGAVKQLGQDAAPAAPGEANKPLAQQAYDMTIGGLASSAKQAGDVMNLFGAPLKAAVSPPITAASNAAYDAGVKPSVGVGGPANFHYQQLTKLQAADQASNIALTAAGLAVPGKAPVGPMLPAATGINPDVVTMRQLGVALTPGQATGGIAKAAEDAATSMPYLGQKIVQARQAGIQSFNKGVLNSALGHIGDQLPDTMPAGHEANSYAQKAFSDAYNNLAPSSPISVTDPQYLQTVAQIPQKYSLAPQSVNQLQNILQTNIGSKLSNGGTLTGNDFQDAISGLKQESAIYGRSSMPEDQRIKAALDDHVSGLEGLASAQDPQYAATKNAIDTGFANFVRAQKAGAMQGAEGGVFTPNQYDAAVRSSDNTVRHGAYASGNALGQDVSTAARAVLPSKMPDSGTAGRSAWSHLFSFPGVVAAGFAGGHVPGAIAATAGYGAGAAGLKAASMLYDPAMIAQFNAGLDANIAKSTVPVAPPTLAPASTAIPLLASPVNVPRLSGPGAAPMQSAAQPQAGPPRKRQGS